jgi:hypothetical protein
MFRAASLYGTNMQQDPPIKDNDARTTVYEADGCPKGIAAGPGSRWLGHKSGTGFQESGDED